MKEAFSFMALSMTREVVSPRVCGHSKKAAVRTPKGESSPRTELASGSISDFVASRTVSDKVSVVEPVCGIWFWQPDQIKTAYKMGKI